MKIVFLDRDGVINEFPGHGNYVTKAKDLHLIPRSLEALRILHERGYTLFVISNQAGVGKGVFSAAKLASVNRKMVREVERAGGKIERVYYCTHRPDAGCSCRKPGVGSIIKAMRTVNKTLRSARNTFFVGDTKSDVETGFNAGCRTIFVLSGRENRRYMRTWLIKPDFVARDLLEATRIIIRFEKTARPRIPRNGVKKSGLVLARPDSTLS